MDYNSLVNQIQQYANRTDQRFIDAIPDFINQGINRIYSEAKNIGFEKTTGVFVLAPDGFEVLKPADWKETISFRLTNENVNPTKRYSFFLLPRSYEFCITYAPQTTFVEAKPKFYAEYDAQTENPRPTWYITPTADQRYIGIIKYLALPQFDAAHPTNFLTYGYPNLLLYSCLLEAAIFLKDDERVPVFESYYNRALQNINRDTVDRYTDRTSKRNKD